MKNMFYVLLVIFVGCSFGNNYTNGGEASYSVE